MQLFITLIVLITLVRITPSQYRELPHPAKNSDHPNSIRFAPVYISLHACELIAMHRKLSHLSLSRLTKLSLVIWLLLLSGDIEVNPGPTNWKYPCGTCSNPVKTNQHGILCEICTRWFHTKCIGMGTKEYTELSESNDAWCCNHCYVNALPYADASILSNDSNLLSSTFDNSLDNSTSLSPTNSTSSSMTANNLQNLKCFLVNARSIVNKTSDLHSLLAVDKPHLVAITETYLDVNILNTELVDNSYSVFRRDRIRQGGGVMIIASNTLPITRRHDLESQTMEILWVEITLHPKPILLGLLYRPPSSKDNLEELQHTL